MIKSMIKHKIAKIIEDAVGQKAELEHPANAAFGDYSTNIALKAKIDPKEIVEKLKDNSFFEKVEVAGPGFINFTLSKNILLEELQKIIKDKDYGKLDIGKNKKIQVEFISANPTGPLTVGNARGGPFGDTLANVLQKAGYKVEREYYVNDYGMQIMTLGHSVLKDEEAEYKGKYIDELHKKNKEKDVYKAGEWAAKEIIKNYIKKTTDKLGIKYDKWLFESELYKKNKVDKVLKYLKEKDLIYEKDGAVWFRAEKFGDNRDRVVVKSNKFKTYLAGDIAHHYYKFEKKKFDKAIDVWGADHHGDVNGLQAGVEAIGYKGKLDIILLQFVTLLVEKGAKKKMSKRKGVYVLMDELIDEVGKDAVRFMFLQKSADTHLNFDIALAKEQSKTNPVYYVQYAYARICSILREAKKNVILSGTKNLSRMRDKGANKLRDSSVVLDASRRDSLRITEELNLIRQLIKFPEIIEDTAKDYQVQRLPYYALELANNFHRFYEQCRVIDKDNPELTQSRLGLVKATQTVLKNILDLMGVEAPKKM